MTYIDILENFGGSQRENSSIEEIETALAVRVNDENPNHHLWEQPGNLVVSLYPSSL